MENHRSDIWVGFEIFFDHLLKVIDQTLPFTTDESLYPCMHTEKQGRVLGMPSKQNYAYIITSFTILFL